MFGIIATIIAVKKRHYTFAWVVGIWTALAFVLGLSGMASIAIAPGALFLFIAIGMKKLPEVGTANTIPQSQLTTEYTPPDTVSNIGQSSGETVSSYYVAQNNQSFVMERAVPEKVAIRFCRYCGQELEPRAKFCGNCGARIE